MTNYLIPNVKLIKMAQRRVNFKSQIYIFRVKFMNAGGQIRVLLYFSAKESSCTCDTWHMNSNTVILALITGCLPFTHFPDRNTDLLRWQVNNGRLNIGLFPLLTWNKPVIYRLSCIFKLPIFFKLIKGLLTAVYLM